MVAPYVGAWIETQDSFAQTSPVNMSHPTWVRGLKQFCITNVRYAEDVAPYVGAWIETSVDNPIIKEGESHPTWVRGLKP